MYIKWITLEVVEAVVDLDSKKIMIKLIDFSSFRVYQRGSSGSYEKGGETAQIYMLCVWKNTTQFAIKRPFNVQQMLSNGHW